MSMKIFQIFKSQTATLLLQYEQNTARDIFFDKVTLTRVMDRSVLTYHNALKGLYQGRFHRNAKTFFRTANISMKIVLLKFLMRLKNVDSIIIMITPQHFIQGNICILESCHGVCSSKNYKL